MAKIYIILSFFVIISSCLLLFLLYSYARYFNMQSVLQEKPDVGQKYLMKLTVIKDLDPFTLACGDLDYSISDIPSVTYPDIFAYIVYTHSFYTHEQMKAYKSLDAHKYFTAGFVLKVWSMIFNDFHRRKVKHSQRANAKPLEVWCNITKDGSVSSSHCTCMAGISEVCSHIAALLFSAEYANRNKSIVSCTDVAAFWLMASISKSVPIAPISEIDFGITADTIQQHISIPTMSKDVIANLLKAIEVWIVVLV